MIGISLSKRYTYVPKTKFVSRYTVPPKRCGITTDTFVFVTVGKKKGILLISSMIYVCVCV